MQPSLPSVAEFAETRETILHEIRKRLQFVADHAQVSLTNCSRDQRYKFANRHYAEHLGLTVDDIVGKKIVDVLGEAAYASIKPYIDKVLTGNRVEYEIVIPYERLGDRWMHVVYEPEYNENKEVIGWVAVVDDVTERRKTEQALRESEHRFRALIENSHDVIFLTNKDGIIHYTSPSIKRVLGYDEHEIIGLAGRTLIHPDDANERDHRRENVLNSPGENINAVARIRHKDGSWRWIELTVTNLLNSQPVNAVVTTFRDITERKAADEKLHRSEERYRAFVAQSTEAIWRFELERPIDIMLPIEQQIDLCYEHAYLAECNDAMAHMYGYNNYSEIIGARLGDLMPRHNPASIAYLTAFAQNNYRITDLESEEIDKDGNVVYFVNNLVGVIENDHIVRAWGTQRDNTARKLYEIQIEQFNQRFAIAETALNGYVYEWDVVNNKVWRSKNFERVLGYQPDDVEATYEGFRNLIHPDDRDRLHKNFENVWHNKPQHYSDEFRVRHKSGHYLWMRDYGCIEWSDSSEPVRMIGSLVNIHEEKLSTQKLEGLVDERTRSLQNSKLSLERLNAELASFAYVASHDLREPIRKVLSFSDYLMRREKEKLSERGMDYLTRMHGSAQRMDSMLDDLLTFSRVNTWNSKRERVELNALLSQAKSTLNDLVTRTDAKVISDNLPQYHGISFQLRQLFIHLLDNAIKFCKPNVQPVIQISCSTVQGGEVNGLDNALYYLHIAVKDNGIGIERQYQEKIFELFQRLHSKDEYNGTGIGLSICRKIVENHQGFLTVDSKFGTGSTFNVYLPID